MGIVVKHGLAAITAVHDVVHGSAVLEANFARHAACNLRFSSTHVKARLTNSRD